MQMMTPGDANALGWSYDEAMAARDAVQDERTAALDALAAENGVERGDGPALCECSGRDEFTRPESGYCPSCEGWVPEGAGLSTAREPDGGVRACERNLYGFCRTCGTDMRECVACGITGGELVRGLTGVLCADAATCEDRFLSAAGAL